MRLLICAGGTGGGVYPAVTVLKALRTDADPVLWVGSQGGLETGLVERAGIPYTAIPAGGVHLSGSDLLRLPGNVLRLLRGVLAARKILKTFQPDLLLYTGGFVAAPMAAAARISGRRIPALVFVPDIEPALALKAIIRTADCIAVTNDGSLDYLSGRNNVVISGYPVRVELLGWERAAARQHFGLSEALPVLLVLGGSRGARPINSAITANLDRLLQVCQVLHISGERDWDEIRAVREQLTPEQAGRYFAYPYLHEDMGAAFAAADLAVSRAGASTLGEYPIYGLPAVLAPYPHAWRYQKINAAYLESKGAALVVKDEDLAGQLVGLVSNLLQDRQRLEQMRTAMRSLAQPQAAETIANLARELAGHAPVGGRS